MLFPYFLISLIPYVMQQSINPKQIRGHTETGNSSRANWCNHRYMAEILLPQDICQMNLKDRDINCFYSIPDCN
ncbi:MAG: hypothetical protein BA864_02970 [Desulfuromonadales bacterium C00003093]|nr:MAG: hypothetical protein BA864_02970 [Desulfuromonadales bacterium C00003093]